MPSNLRAIGPKLPPEDRDLWLRVSRLLPGVNLAALFRTPWRVLLGFESGHAASRGTNVPRSAVPDVATPPRTRP